MFKGPVFHLNGRNHLVSDTSGIQCPLAIWLFTFRGLADLFLAQLFLGALCSVSRLAEDPAHLFCATSTVRVTARVITPRAQIYVFIHSVFQ